LISTHHISKRYASKTALDGVSITIPQGDIYGLLGPNGSGKTTLIRILTQIIAPDSGSIMFKNRSFSKDDLALIGYLPEERGLYPKMKVEEQLLYYAALRGMSSKAAKAAVHDWITRLELDFYKNKPVKELSKGWQQKVQLAAAAVHRPELLILDEPFTGFDPLNTEVMKENIIRLKNEGTTVVLSAHRMDTVEELCKNICLIYHSKKIIEGEVYQIKKQFKKEEFFIETSEPIVLNSDFISILEEIPLPSGRYKTLIAVTKPISTKDLIALILAENEVCSFQENIPSLHTIFFNIISDYQQSNVL
jgi:ABC-2 type transport system ATP-binding protein